ncbi:MAG: 4-(cytidine 5'-diphospho)-2-C-methyl-D-erythritol kinase [Paludibacteraceae bacterium]|nr:4-(cytidine 5'-diphospho)-2-C-methyl-D-erythritol kinase [Paludibacteraceae bacterium]
MITFPNAKINIGLNITEKRSDGYHNLETIFYPIDLCDSLEFVQNDETQFNCTGLKIEGEPENNLILKAYKQLKEEFNLPNIDIHLHKAIPMGAGLGGGSADAAFMLKMLNDEFKLSLSSQELEQKAAKLGADCAFFIKNKPTLAKGIGNIFEPTTINLSGYHIVLIKPEVHVSTAEAYGGCKPQRWTTPLEEAIKRPISEWKNCIFNDFEKTVFIAHPELAEIKDMLYNEGAVYAAMSGSGSTIYGLFENAIINNFTTKVKSQVYCLDLK